MNRVENLRRGASGLVGNPGDASALLDPDFYGRVYPDLRNLSRFQLTRHWSRVGVRENRISSAVAARGILEGLGVEDFDPELYLLLNPDLGQFEGDPDRALFHFVTEGWREGRPYSAEAVLSSHRSRGSDGKILTVDTSAMPAGDVWREVTDDSPNLEDPVELAQFLLGRPLGPADAEAIQAWLEPLSSHDRVAAILQSDEFGIAEFPLQELPADEFLMIIEVLATGHMPDLSWLDRMLTLLDYGRLRRDRYLLSRAPEITGLTRSRLFLEEQSTTPSDVSLGSSQSVSVDLDESTRFTVLGTDRIASLDDWLIPTDQESRTKRLPSASRNRTRGEFANYLDTDTEPVVAVLASIYKPGTFLESFLADCLDQSIRKNVEFCFVLVEPSEMDLEMVREASIQMPLAKELVVDDRIGIYQAWNLALKETSAPLVTNMNVDDRRRFDSLEIQACWLLEHGWIDVVYQDFYYSMDAEMTFEEIAAVGLSSALPHVTARTLRGLNSPHHAPMWRRSLHDRFGVFDDSLVSAGDYEFWLRCADGGAQFYKLREPHCAYFVNPDGLSTRPDGVGQKEAWKAELKHWQGVRYPALRAAGPFVGQPCRADRLSQAFVRQAVSTRLLLEGDSR